MIYLGWFILIFTAVQFLVALINLLFSDRMQKIETQSNPLVSVLIPARNEEERIADLVKDILAQSYTNIELIVCDDGSEDNTSQIIKDFIKKDRRVRLIQTTELLPGWTGKNHACYSLANEAKGQYYLFLDADVRIGGNLISRSFAFMERRKLGLISIFPKQIMESWGEKFTVPVMNYILLTLLPLILVRHSAFKSLSAANGQFMFFNALVYHVLKPHERFKSDKVEDIHIARWYKTNGIRISCQLGNREISCRMYQSWGEAVNGFAKNVTSFFGNSFLLAIVFWAITTLGFIVILLLFPLWIFLVYLGVFHFTRILVSIRSRQNIFENLLLILPQQASLGAFIFQSFVNTKKREYQWKGRIIPS